MTGAATTTFPIFAAAANEQRRPLVLSLHDVAPPTRVATEKMLAAACRHGLRVTSLLVVPDYHHTGASMADRDFVRWLRDLESDGHEIVIHGYYHQRPRQPSESWRARFVTRTYTNDEGEFYDLDFDEAQKRIARAREEFHEAGLKPRGFIAPAWLLSDAAERAAAAEEMEYTTRLRTVRDLRSGQTTAARSLVYSVRNSWRRLASRAWNFSLARMLAQAPLLRLSLHPPDFEDAAVWKQITELMTKFSETRRATTYRDWIAEQRLQKTP